MASPLAAYDPLYLSHMAFMDKLWTQWQEKHERASKIQTHDQQINLYPAGQRHRKMEPFNVTPSDVISTQRQMCVVYVPITIGAPCNMTLFQKHPQASRKSRKINFAKRKLRYSGFVSGAFDSSGYNQHGYDRDGYDRSGWNRCGYGKDGFNRDFIDREGYDITGFNRYGFNRNNVTRFSMNRDGLLETKKKKKRYGEEDSDEKTPDKANIMSELFGDKGYSMYGFDPFGLDRGGFDAFGFRTDGYDKDSCNWFFNGPHYLRFYFHTQQQLMSLSDRALNHIARTCPPITVVPTKWAAQDWMTFEPIKSIGVDRQAEQDWVGQNKPETEESIAAAKQIQKKIWLPITPDRRYRLYNYK